MPKKEKILICGILPPPFFGHSAMYKILMESSFVDAFDITFLNMKFWSYAQHQKVTVGKLMKFIKYFVQYKWLIITKRPRYVLYNMSFDKMPFLKDFLFCFIGRLFGCRIVIHDMGQYVRELYDSSGRIYRALIRWLLRNVTACILLGERTKLAYQGFIPQNRLFAVPGSVEDSRQVDCPEERGQELSRDVNVLYFSYMTPSKGVLTACQAVPKVLDNNHHIRFTFAGPMGPDSVRAAFEQISGRYNSRVGYRGYIGDVTERTKLYRGADIFIFPTHRDVFGLVLLHAMAESLPVIASIEGTIPEIIKDGENGFLIDKGNADQLASRILQLASDRTLRKAMGEANRKRYEDVYSPKVYGRNMIQVFEEINRLP